MYARRECPVCNHLMIGEFMRGIVIYTCPTQSEHEIGTPKLHQTDFRIDPKDVFKSLKDEYSHSF